MKDGVVEEAEPEGMVAYTCVPFREWFNDIPYAWSTMNLFRSEEHVRNYSSFKADTEEGIIPLLDMAKIFSSNFFTRRLDPDYVSHMPGYTMKLVGAFQGRGPFWQPPNISKKK